MTSQGAMVLAAGSTWVVLWALVPRPMGHLSPGRSGPEAGQRRVLFFRLILCLGAAAGAALVHWGWALPVFCISWYWLQRSPQRSRERGNSRDLPHLVALMVGPLRAGATPTVALRQAADALPGSAAFRLNEPLAKLAVGVDPAQVWRDLANDPVLGELGRALARAHRSGTPLTPTVERLAADLAGQFAGEIEDRARTVGVRAAIPLGLCLLPAFLLLGVVPLAAGLFGSILG